MVDTYGAVAGLEAIELLLGLGELLLGHLRLQHLLDKLPELLVLVVEQDHDARGLRVEAAGHVEHAVLDNLLDAGVGNGDLVGDLVNGSAVLAGLEEVHGRGHSCFSGTAAERCRGYTEWGGLSEGRKATRLNQRFQTRASSSS